jgi:hypothetical protein
LLSLKLLQLRLIRVIGGKLGVMMKLSEGIHAELVAALYLV